jgi:hypothetical protein
VGDGCDRVDDGLITGAPAIIAGQMLSDAIPRRIILPSQQILHGY